MRQFVSLAVIVASLIASASQTMQFKRVPIDGFGDIYTAIGPIIPGDTDRLRAAVLQAPDPGAFRGLSVDTPGGNLAEAEKLAGLISATNAGVVVLGNSQCASACFLVFAAAKTRLIGKEALIGVHSASINGQEDTDSLAITTAFARDLGQYGVPPAIVGKLVETTPNRIEWLTPEDLALLGVRYMAEAAPAGPAAPPGPSALPPAQAFATAQPHPQAFEIGGPHPIRTLVRWAHRGRLP